MIRMDMLPCMLLVSFVMLPDVKDGHTDLKPGAIPLFVSCNAIHIIYMLYILNLKWWKLKNV